MSLEVRRMRHAIALAEHRSFARAAMALGLSQSALSRSIQSVEREVGSELFVRNSNGIELTDSGRVFVARIQQIVQLTEDLDRDLVNERGLHSGQLHVGGGPYPAQSILADALARFVAAHPRVVVRVMMRDWDELARRLRAREIEFFVAEYSTFGSDTDLDIEPLDAHQTLIYARIGHPLTFRTPVNFVDGLTYPYASLCRIPPRTLEPIRAMQRRLPEPMGAQQVFPALECNSLDAIKRIVQGSDALMVAPPSCVLTELEDGSLVPIGSEPFLVLRYAIVKLRSHPLTAAGARFREYVLEAERAFTERERALLERWWPRTRTSDQAGTSRSTSRATQVRTFRERQKVAGRGD